MVLTEKMVSMEKMELLVQEGHLEKMVLTGLLVLQENQVLEEPPEQMVSMVLLDQPDQLDQLDQLALIVINNIICI